MKLTKNFISYDLLKYCDTHCMLFSVRYYVRHIAWTNRIKLNKIDKLINQLMRRFMHKFVLLASYE